jgi:hypothetical protein
MITLQDCIAMCDLDEAEVLAIAEHEHIPEIRRGSARAHVCSIAWLPISPLPILTATWCATPSA